VTVSDTISIVEFVMSLADTSEGDDDEEPPGEEVRPGLVTPFRREEAEVSRARRSQM